VERLMGIGPTYLPWEGDANYIILSRQIRFHPYAL
jgi:hypothetical protein